MDGLPIGDYALLSDCRSAADVTFHLRYRGAHTLEAPHG